MKKLVITPAKYVILGEQIIANESLRIQPELFVFYKDKLMSALEERIEICLKDLNAAVEENKIVQVDEHVITFVYPSGVSHKFLVPSYLAMEKALTTLDTLDKQITISELTKKFTKPEINQMKKAMIDYEGFWSEAVSTLEEIEMTK